MTDINNSNDTNSETKTNSILEVRQKEFNSALHEYQMKKKLDYKRFLKSQGISTSSDEEDNTVIKSDEACGFNMNGCQKKDKTDEHLKCYKLPKDLENSKKQRYHLNAEAKSVRALRHHHFLETSDKSVELTQCRDSSCVHCGRYKKKDEPEVVVPKRWPPENRKIKESKEKLKNSFEEYKRTKKQAYYDQKTDTDIRSNQTNTNVEKKSLTQGEVEEEEQLNQAILLSQMENEALIGQDTYLEDEDGLQLAIDMSFAEAENNRISPVQKSDDEEDLQLSLAKKLSLNGINKEKIEPEQCTDPTNIGLCVVCYKKNFLKRFVPCNDTCICDECAEEYNSQTCPICREYYSTISWNM